MKAYRASGEQSVRSVRRGPSGQQRQRAQIVCPVVERLLVVDDRRGLDHDALGAHLGGARLTIFGDERLHPPGFCRLGRNRADIFERRAGGAIEVEGLLGPAQGC